MKTLEQCKNEIAKKYGFQCWFNEIANEKLINEDTLLYASEVAKEVLKRAAENAMLEPNGMMLQVDKSSILNTEYQDLLK